jgi:hypothetical protein
MDDMSRKGKIVFGLSGLLVLLACAQSPVLLPYPLFVLAVLCGWRLPKVSTPAVGLLLSTWMSTAVLEVSAWLDNFVRNSPDPALFHPQLIPDLVISLGVYGAWWLTWWLMLRRYHFTIWQVFITTGMYGVLIEQGGAVFLAGLKAFPGGLLVWLLVAVAYGSTMALAFYLVRDRFTSTRDHWLKYLWAWGALLALTITISLLWGWVLDGLGVIPPEKLPMRDYPFW